MLKLKIIKPVFVFLIFCFLTGCSFKGKKTLFEREGDTLTLSPCEQCSEKPFYVHGHWVQ